MQTKGVLVVVSGFSGAGKGTVMKALLEKYDNYALSVSATTRSPRPGEENGREYFFLTESQFEDMIRNDELINTFTASQMFYCVNERLNRNKGTIISTNLTLGELQDAFTERVTSRIMSKYKIIPLIGDDLRLVRRGFVRRG